MTMEQFGTYCKIAISKGVVKRAIKVSLIVGTALNLINQGEAIVMLNIEDVNFLKFFLTYLVPYGVTTYTATAMKLEFQIGTKAIVETDLECKGSGEIVHVKEGQIIPECAQCGVNTHWKLK